MGRIRMHVYIDNQSDAALRLLRTEVEHGDFTPDWQPHAVINAGQRLGFQGEGDLTVLPTTGTEGRVWYHIDAPDGGELYIHWNSPLVESQYGNTFHVLAPPGWDVTQSGGQGHSADLEIRVRRTARRLVPNFSPYGRGFDFKNTWDHGLPVMSLGFLWNKLFDSLPGPLGQLGIGSVVADDFAPITHGDAGMCGGMVFAVMDYYAHHLLPPDLALAPVSRDDVLFTYLRDRLWDSFDVGGRGHRFLGYSSPHYPNGDEGVIQTAGLARGRAWVTYRDALPQIQGDIDAGNLSPIGLIQTTNLDIAKNHQVLVYGYQKSGQNVQLYIYDPNFPHTEVTYDIPDIADTTGEVHVNRTPEDPTHRIWCIFRVDGYAPKLPPNGRSIASSIRAALRATTIPSRGAGSVHYSMRSAMAASGHTGSVREWVRSL